MDIKFKCQPQGELTKEVYEKPTHTNRYVAFSSHHPISVKSGVVACLANRAIRESSSQAGKDAELCRIQKVIMRNGYPRKFINKVVSSQIKRHPTSCALKQQKQTTNEPRPKTVSIPFVEGLSQEVRRLAHTTLALGAHFSHQTHFALFIIRRTDFQQIRSPVLCTPGNTKRALVNM